MRPTWGVCLAWQQTELRYATRTAARSWERWRLAGEFPGQCHLPARGWHSQAAQRAHKEYTWNATNEIRYVWIGMSLVQERDAANRVRVTYTGGLAREDSTFNPQPSTTYYFTDGNRNVSALIDSRGNFKARYRYDSFGNLLSKSGPLADVNLLRFSGKEYHPRSGLYYYGFRYYQPNLQRWLNEDPIGIAGGMNLYGFVGNDPVDSADEDGRWFGDLAAGLGNKLDEASDRSCNPAAGAMASLMSDLAHMAAGFDSGYALKEGLKQDANTLMNGGVGAYVEQKYGQLEEAVGTSDIVKAVD